MNKKFLVYVHINKVNGKRYYGITSRKPEYRWNHGKGYQKGHIKNAINKYGWDGFDHIIIARDLTEDEAKWLEIEMIAAHNTTNRKYGYNFTEGGDGCKGMKGEKHPMYGKHHTEEWRQNHSNMMSGENHPMYGKHHTKDTKQKLRDINLGKHHTEEAKKKISETNTGENNPMYGKRGELSPNYGKHHAEETKQKIRDTKIGKSNPAARTTICITTKRIFYTAKDGADFYNINPSGVHKCCKGKHKSAGKLPDGTKLVWRYLNYKHNKTYRIA